ncbi:MAG TPA: hypothetical protein VLL98_05580 [Rickettsiales bacterium]|nr:hypothetical protein [Rickettsiales bacterium]
MKKYILVFLFSVLFVSNSYAKKFDMFTPQKQTPEGLVINTLSKPDNFNTSNDLTRYVGSFDVATGELLYLKGVITDAFGVPIEGATVKIWQTNSAGKYQTLLEEDSVYVDENFLMSGTAKSDNLGRYGFKTIFPGVIKGRAPHINIIISHPKFATIETEVYFENHFLNKKDPQYMSYSKEDRDLLTAKVVNYDRDKPQDGKIATFNIIMDGIHAYKSY